uniref:Uncharacterized protein n=1 Tax=Acrobeloides nanus TaxID=290746 RepID=A0A914CA46_9BILA
MIGHGDTTDSIRSRQIAGLKQILNLNQPVSSSMAIEPVWKLLILDKYGQDIISPLLPIKQLRELGITLHLLINSKRETLPDVPSVYFVSPTDENIRIICDDLKKSLYEMFYLNMIYPISREYLEELAAAAVHGGTMQNVQKVTDQYLSFISLEDDLFMLRRYSQESPFSFYAINDPSIEDRQMDDLIDTIVKGLFSVCVTLTAVPIIKCKKGNAAALVAAKLAEKLRDNLRDARNNLFTQENIRAGHMNFHRPVLIIADRNMDLATMLHHTWTYQAMIHDVLDMDLNRIRMVDKNGKKKEYDMAAEDKLWSSYKGSPFPLVAEAIQSDLDSYRKNEEEIKRLKASMGLDENSSFIDSESGVFMYADENKLNSLSSAVGSLPELLEKKRLIDLHTNVATAVLDNIKERKLDVLFETEEKILNGQNSESSILDVLKSCTNNDDAIRLTLIHLLCTQNITASEKEKILTYLQEREIDPSAIKALEQIRAFSDASRISDIYQGAGTKTESMFSKLLTGSSELLMKGVKNLVPRKHNLPLTKMVDQLIDTRPTVGVGSVTMSGSGPDPDEFLYFDPKLMHASTKDLMKARTGQLAMDVIVFVVGGGNYVEYQNIHEYGKTKGLHRITYGCTEVVTPKQFTDQLTRLGQKFSER